MGKAVHYLVYAQLCFFGLLLLCFAMLPTGLSTDTGITYFGTHWPTAIPYFFSYALCGAFMLKAADSLPQHQLIARGLRSIVVLLPFVLLTPFTLNYLFDWSHRVISGALFLIELFLTIRLVAGQKGLLNLLLLAFQAIGGLIAMFSLANILHTEILGQLMFQLAFGVLLVRLVAQLTAEAPATATSTA